MITNLIKTTCDLFTLAHSEENAEIAHVISCAACLLADADEVRRGVKKIGNLKPDALNDALLLRKCWPERE